jgi:sugar phosphate isomerase/epimerase
MAPIPVGLQLYSIRNDCAVDLPGALAAVSRMGYAGVEFAGYYNRSAKELRTMLDDLGLKCCGTHIRIDTLLGDALPATVEFNQILGNKYLIVPGLAEEHRSSRAAWLRTAGIFNEIAERLKPYGMLTGYHNHFIEFQPMEGELPWDTFFGNARPDVIMQVDIGNALHGGGDPIPYLARYPGRAITVHLKEYSATDTLAILGEGDVPWAHVFDLCETQGGTKWYIVEQESYKYPPLEVVSRCLDALRGMGKA